MNFEDSLNSQPSPKISQNPGQTFYVHELGVGNYLIWQMTTSDSHTQKYLAIYTKVTQLLIKIIKSLN